LLFYSCSCASCGISCSREPCMFTEMDLCADVLSWKVFSLNLPPGTSWYFTQISLRSPRLFSLRLCGVYVFTNLPSLMSFLKTIVTSASNLVGLLISRTRASQITKDIMVDFEVFCKDSKNIPVNRIRELNRLYMV